MTFNYDPSLPTDQDSLRLTLGDTNEDDPLFEDEELAAVLAATVSRVEAAAQLAEALALRFEREPQSIVLGDARMVRGDAAVQYRALATALRAQNSLLAAPWIGGQTWTEKQAAVQDWDRVQPAFSRERASLPPAADPRRGWWW